MLKKCKNFNEKFQNSQVLGKDLKGFFCIKNLGIGGFGETFLFKKGLKKLVVKAVYREQLNQEDIINEINILKKIKKNCKNVLCHEKVISNFIITEFIDGKSMWDYYYDNKLVSKLKTFGFIKQLFKALEQIHKLGIIHFDVKPENIMISKNNLKLIDFGGAFYSIDKKQVVQKVYTPCYSPLEIPKSMTFEEGIYVDYFCSIRSFRHDDAGIISPLKKVSNVSELYNLFDSSTITFKNYKKRILEIKKLIS